jgi:hypothetical protein
MQENPNSELDKLFSNIGKYRSTNEYRELIEFIGKFPHIAPYNAMLIHVQKPGSRYVTSALEWEKKYTRTIKPGARPLVILRPFGPVAFVFELADTEGDTPLPNDLLNPFSVKGSVDDYLIENLIQNIKSDGISYFENNFGTSMAGYIQEDKYESYETIYQKTKKITIKRLFNIVVNSNHPLETKFSTVIHELAHLFCGHLGNYKQKWLSDRKGLSLNIMEFEAKSVCWLICERMGLKNPSEKYLNGYLNNNGSIPNVSIDTILKVTSTIETLLKEGKQPRKELIVKTEKLGQQKFEL